MATRSYVGIINNDNTIRYIYIHWDGNPKFRLPILDNFYNTPEKINALLDLGDLSSLDNSIEKPEGHTFDNPIEGYCVSYHRDRGEPFKDTKAKKGIYYQNNDKTFSILDIPKKNVEFIYLFDIKNNHWLITRC